MLADGDLKVRDIVSAGTLRENLVSASTFRETLYHQTTAEEILYHQAHSANLQPVWNRMRDRNNLCGMGSW